MENYENSKINVSIYIIAALAIIYGATTIMMNMFSTKPLSFGSPIIIMDAGTLISWIPFAIITIIVSTYGKKLAREISIISTITNFLIMVLAFIICKIPTLSSYSEQNTHFNYVFNSGPRIIIASALALLIGTQIKINILDKLITNSTDKSKFFAKAELSSLIGQLLDNTVFELLAFAPLGITLYEMEIKDIITTILSTTAFEIIFETIFFLPITNQLINKIQNILKK